ncbi:MAG TPA: GNAT family N-acetyltransferase [Bacteroidia bacterium]|nr:GNAT family N-acetyltransferase [Bacteroidia bacterium]
MNEISLVPAGKNDMQDIASLAETIWKTHYTPIIGEKQVEYMLGLMYSGEGMKKQIDEGQQFFFVKENGRNAGYISVSDKGNGEFFLHKFYIAVSQQGKGLGKKVFALILQQFPSLASLTLTVNRKNYKSVNFYFRLGFVISEVKDFDIGNGFFMEDFVMNYKRAGTRPPVPPQE